MVSGSTPIEYGNGADRGSGPAAPLHRQTDESELALAEQCFQIAEAFDVGDIDVETDFVNECVHGTLGAGPHRIDAEMHDALFC